jgi:hypothetical protein
MERNAPFFVKILSDEWNRNTRQFVPRPLGINPGRPWSFAAAPILFCFPPHYQRREFLILIQSEHFVGPGRYFDELLWETG